MLDVHDPNLLYQSICNCHLHFECICFTGLLLYLFLWSHLFLRCLSRSAIPPQGVRASKKRQWEKGGLIKKVNLAFDCSRLSCLCHLSVLTVCVVFLLWLTFFFFFFWSVTHLLFPVFAAAVEAYAAASDHVSSCMNTFTMSVLNSKYSLALFT